MKQAIVRRTQRIFIGLIALVAITVVGITFIILAEKYWMAQFNRTHERPLQVDPSHLVLESAHRLLSKLQPEQSGNRLQFVVMPSFGKRWFAVSIAEVNGQGVGEAIVEARDTEHLERRAFIMSRAELLTLLERWDALTDGYSGEGHALTDGSPLAFERRRGERVTSGEGNSPCHYGVLGDWAAQRLSQYVPELQDLRYFGDKPWKSDDCNRSIFSL